MHLIFAIDKNYAIGKEGKLLFRIPEDQAHFKRRTEGHIVIMGRKTLMDLPGYKGLPNRTNIVLTRDYSFQAQDAIVVNSVRELLELLEEINPNSEKIEYVIGGGNVAFQLLDYCDRATLTLIDTEVKGVDSWVPNLYADNSWALVKESEDHYYQDLTFRYQEYVRVPGVR